MSQRETTTSIVETEQSRKYRERLLAQLAGDRDFAIMAEAIRTGRNGGTLEVTISSNDRIKSVGARLRIEKR